MHSISILAVLVLAISTEAFFTSRSSLTRLVVTRASQLEAPMLEVDITSRTPSSTEQRSPEPATPAVIGYVGFGAETCATFGQPWTPAALRINDTALTASSPSPAAELSHVPVGHNMPCCQPLLPEVSSYLAMNSEGPTLLVRNDTLPTVSASASTTSPLSTANLLLNATAQQCHGTPPRTSRVQHHHASTSTAPRRRWGQPPTPTLTTTTTTTTASLGQASSLLSPLPLPAAFHAALSHAHDPSHYVLHEPFETAGHVTRGDSGATPTHLGPRRGSSIKASVFKALATLGLDVSPLRTLFKAVHLPALLHRLWRRSPSPSSLDASPVLATDSTLWSLAVVVPSASQVHGLAKVVSSATALLSTAPPMLQLAVGLGVYYVAFGVSLKVLHRVIGFLLDPTSPDGLAAAFPLQGYYDVQLEVVVQVMDMAPPKPYSNRVAEVYPRALPDRFAQLANLSLPCLMGNTKRVVCVAPTRIRIYRPATPAPRPTPSPEFYWPTQGKMHPSLLSNKMNIGYKHVYARLFSNTNCGFSTCALGFGFL